jgi:tetratricopeptide (TPR) repeat protein
LFLPFSKYFRLRVGLLMIFFGLVALGAVQTKGFVEYQFSGPSAWILIIVGAAIALSSLVDMRVQAVRPEQKWEAVADAGMLLGMNDRWDEAMSEFRRAIMMTGAEPRRLRAAELIGGYLVDHKKLTEAEPFLADALTLRTRLFGPTQPLTVALRERLGDLYLGTGQAAAAAQVMRSQMDLLASTGGADLIDQANAAARLSTALHQQGDVSGAEQALQRATAAIAATDQFSPALVKPLVSLSDLALSKGDHVQAESFLKRAQECASRVGAKDELRLVRARLLGVYSAAGRYAEAAPLSEKLLSESSGVGKASDPAETSRLHRQHADLLDRAGRPDDAIKHRRIAETLERIARPSVSP